MNDIDFHVVTKENLNEFVHEIEEEVGNVVFFAISVIDYERLALNMAELKRYIHQQGSLIVYYETIIKESKKRHDTSPEHNDTEL